MINSLKLSVIFIIFLFHFGCGSPGEVKKLGALDDAINEYAYALRWGRIDDALAFHIDEDGVRPDIDVSNMKFIRVTGFDIKRRTVNPEQTEATVQSELNYYNDQYGTLKSLEYAQLWWYQPDTKKWLLNSEYPQFQ
ncbi:MAG: hypothetical protein ACKVHQ_02095 [Gammaproteobacteria bacterium]|jgi:hypothetical protein